MLTAEADKYSLDRYPSHGRHVDDYYWDKRGTHRWNDNYWEPASPHETSGTSTHLSLGDGSEATPDSDKLVPEDVDTSGISDLARLLSSQLGPMFSAWMEVSKLPPPSPPTNDGDATPPAPAAD